jgi:hypothetical protein
MRPDLSHLTNSQIKFLGSDMANYECINFYKKDKEVLGSIKCTKSMTNTIQSIPHLVEIAETMHDMLKSNPDSILFKNTERVLNFIKQ